MIVARALIHVRGTGIIVAIHLVEFLILLREQAFFFKGDKREKIF
jgi:hypothetical protein